MPFLAEFTMPSGTTYQFKDAYARNLIKELLNFHEWLGITTTPLTEGSTVNPITISGEQVTATEGDVATYQNDEFVYSSVGTWQKFANLSGLGALAFKNSASGSYTPAGTVSQPTFTGSELTSAGKFTPSGNISGAAVTMSKTTIKNNTSAGSMPTFTVSGETLIVTDGAVPTFEDVTVATDVDQVTQPTFAGTEGDVTVKGTPAGAVSQPTFSGTSATITVE